MVERKVKLSIENVSHEFLGHGTKLQVLDKVSFPVAENEFVCLLGPSGCGKTTLLNIIAGFILPTSGSVQLSGSPITGPDPNRGYVFQDHNLFPWKTVGENIEFGLKNKGMSSYQRMKRVKFYLAEIGLPEFVKYYPHQLSGGMRQRVSLARAFANEPEILLMDEPFASLDLITAYKMYQLLSHMCELKPKTILFVTHNIDEAILLADKIIVFSSRPGSVQNTMLINLARPRKADLFWQRDYMVLKENLASLLYK